MSAATTPGASGRGSVWSLFGVIRAARRRQRRRRLIVAVVGGVALVLLIMGTGWTPNWGGSAPHADRAPATARSQASAPPGDAAPSIPTAAYAADVNPGNGIQFVSGRVGFALSGQPLNSLDGHLSAPAGLVLAWPSPAVIASRDGGRHWRSSLSSPAGFWGVEFADRRHGWAIGVVALYRTVDGGARWQRAGEPADPLVRVAFATPAHGFGLTVGGQLVESTDGGRSWHASRWNGKGAALCTSNPRHILVADQTAGVWSSDDGGAGWRRVAAGLGHMRGFSPWLPDLSCQKANAVELEQAYCEAACAGGVISRARQTTDAGRNWHPILNRFGKGISEPITERAVAVARSGACFVNTSATGLDLRCSDPDPTDAGHATVPPLPFSASRTSLVVQGIDFYNATHGWLLFDQTTHAATASQANSQTQVWSTDDGGSTWQVSYREPTHHL